jgi:outer membrane immunogenic protein
MAIFTKNLLASLAVGALIVGSPAKAADIQPRPAPAYYPPAAPPIYSWTGFYLGGNAGGAWATSTNPLNTTETTGFIGGGQVGFNFFLPPGIVLGVEGDFDGLTNKSTDISFNGAVQHDHEIKWLSTARGRVGWAFDRLLVYGTGGFAWAQEDVTRTQLATAGGIPAGTVDQITNNRTGWTAGGGLEYAFLPNWTAKVEYLFADLGSVTNTFPNAGITNQTFDLHVNTVRAGVNYKFNLGGW